MVGDATLGEVVGADALVAHPAAHLAAALGGHFALLRLHLLLIQPRAEDLQGFFLILQLTPLILALHHHAGGQMGDADGGGGLVDVLSAGTGGAEGVDAQIVSVQLELHVIHLRQHCHGDGAGVDAPAGFRLRHPLNPMDAALVFHSGVGSRPVQGKHGLFHAAQFRLTDADLLLLPPLFHTVHSVHPTQGVGE